MSRMSFEKRVTMSQWDMYRALLDLSPQDSPFILAFYMFTAACSLTLGALGLIRVKKHRDHPAIAAGSYRNPEGEPRV